jgi:hypothetical protein
VERKRNRDDEHLDPGHDAAHHGEGTADGLASGKNCPDSGRGEGLLGSLPLVLTVRTATQEPVRVLPAPLPCPGLGAASHRCLEQEVSESGQR